MPYLVHRVGLVMSADGIGLSSEPLIGCASRTAEVLQILDARGFPGARAAGDTRQGLGACRYFGAAGDGCACWPRERNCALFR